jgi:V8-like Glu-specific endopeptidase
MNMKKFISAVIRVGAYRKCFRLTVMRNFILSVILSGILVPFTVLSQTIPPTELHAVPVQMKFIDGTPVGTGLYFLESNKQFLVSAAHCIFNVLSTNTSELLHSQLVITSLITNDNTRLTNLLYLNLTQLQQDGRIQRHSSHDVAVIYWADESTNHTTFTSCNGAYFRQSGQMLDAETNACVLFTNVPDGCETLILGYPSELLTPAKQWLTSALQSQVDFEYPLYRKGIISQKNRLTRKLIIDSGVYGGNSGGPVFIMQHPSFDTTAFKLVGIITEFVPTETRTNPQWGVTNSILVNSGYGVVEPIDYAIDLMRTF